jgi:hypothetical protein
MFFKYLLLLSAVHANDVWGPAVTEKTVTPETVTAGEMITFQYTVSDPSGITQPRSTDCRSEAGQSCADKVNYKITLLAGDEKFSATYEVSWNVSLYGQNGIFLFQPNVYDKVGHRVNNTGIISFVVVGSVEDNTPPEVMFISITPTVVRPGDTAVLTWRVRDLESGLRHYGDFNHRTASGESAGGNCGIRTISSPTLTAGDATTDATYTATVRANDLFNDAICVFRSNAYNKAGVGAYNSDQSTNFSMVGGVSPPDHIGPIMYNMRVFPTIVAVCGKVTGRFSLYDEHGLSQPGMVDWVNSQDNSAYMVRAMGEGGAQ